MMKSGSPSARIIAAGGGLNAFSDNFAGTLSNWTILNAAGFAISSGVLRYAPGVGWTPGDIFYSNAATGSVTHYAKVTVPYYTHAANGHGILLRSEASSGGYKYLVKNTNGTLIWERVLWDDLWTTQTIASTSMAFSAGNSIGVTVQGTGTSTVVKVWSSPTNNTPVDKDNWDTASDPADYTLTDTNSYLATNNANTGQYVGLYSYIDSNSSAYNDYDNFYGGGL